MIDKDEVTNSWMETYTGRRVNPAVPRIEDISIIDVAHSLSMQCRYNGHTKVFYTVAQHCNIMFDWFHEHGHGASTCLKALLHDSGEAYCSDVPRPIKHLAPDLVKAERAMTALVYRLVGLVEDEDDALIHDVDTRMIREERIAFMAPSENKWKTDDLEPLGFAGVLKAAPVEEVYQGFMARYATATRLHLGYPVYMDRHDWTDAALAHSDSPNLKIMDVLECDVLGGVALVLERGDEGMLVRDDARGWPIARRKWVHGKFLLKDSQ